MPELERLMLHSLAELDAPVRQAYATFDYKRIFATLIQFMTIDLSAFYFDIRKDALYCDPHLVADAQGRAHRDRPAVPLPVTWLAPMLCFTAEEAWLSRYPGEETSVHLELVPRHPGELSRRGAGREMAQDPHRAPRRDRRARGRARQQAHRLVARGGADRLRLRRRSVRRAGRDRSRRGLRSPRPRP